MINKINPDDIVARECRFAVYCPSKQSMNDIHFIKEIIHTKSGARIPNTRIIRNKKRKFYITKKGAQTHQQKKEFEKLENLNSYECTQSTMVTAIARAIGEPYFKGPTRKLYRNPYIYGADITSTALIKAEYKEKYPDVNTPFSIAVLDVETDVLHGTEEIIMCTISFKDKVYTAIKKSVFEGQANVLHRIHEAIDKYLTEYISDRNIKFEIDIVDSEIDICINCINRAHQWQPDFLTLWNMDFDISRFIKACERANYDPAKLFSDPSVPDEFKYFYYKQGPKQKVTASGKMTPIKPAMQWHSVFTPASFYVIDSMCAYRHIRIASPEEAGGYSLDNILTVEKCARKLKFEQANHLSGIDWHIFMQESYPIEYSVYNMFDCISVELLQEKLKDLSVVLPMFSGASDFDNFKSQPRRLVDRLHIEWLSQGYVIATTSDQMVTEIDKMTTPATGWIVCLPANLIANNGLCVFEDAPMLRSNCRLGVADEDVAAS